MTDDEMAEDIADFDAAMAEGGPAIPWAQVKADLGWDDPTASLFRGIADAEEGRTVRMDWVTEEVDDD